MSDSSKILTLATQVQDQDRRLANTRENLSRTYKDLEKVVNRLSWIAQMENALHNMTEQDKETYKKSREGDEDRILTRLKQITNEVGIYFRSLIGVGNAFNKVTKELLALSTVEIGKQVREANIGAPNVHGLTEDSTKASPVEAAAAEARAEARDSITNEKSPTAPNLVGPSL